MLRLAMEKFIPEEIRNRRKQGFSSPDESWYRGPNLDFVQHVILDRKALLHNFISRKKIMEILDDHCRKRINRRLIIWSMLCFENWLKIFMDGKPEASAFSFPDSLRPILIDNQRDQVMVGLAG